MSAAHPYVRKKKSTKIFLIPSEETNKTTKVLPKQICNFKTTVTHSQCDSTIGLHLLHTPQCATEYSNEQFSILAKAKSMFLYYRIICIIDDGARRRRTLISRFRARRADHSTTDLLGLVAT